MTIGLLQFVDPPSFSGLLDQFPGATVLLSLSKESSTYSGACFNVRRSSDNATQDIGFDTNGFASASSLTAFVGSGTGFVTTWYRQDGSANHAIQPTAAFQWVAYVDTDGFVCFAGAGGQAIASQATASGSTLTFYSSTSSGANTTGLCLPPGLSPGMSVLDMGSGDSAPLTTINATTTISSVNYTTNTVTLSHAVTGAGVSANDIIGFSMNGTGMYIPDETKYKTAQLDCFIIAQPGYQPKSINVNNQGGSFGWVWGGYGTSGAPLSGNWEFGVENTNGFFSAGTNASMNGAIGDQGEVYQSVYGQAHLGVYQIWGWNTYNNVVQLNGTPVGVTTGGISVNQSISYTGTTRQLTIGNANGFGINFSTPFYDYRGKIRTYIMYGGTVGQLLSSSTRTGINTYLQNRWSVANLPASIGADSNGFTATPEYFPTFSAVDGPDGNGLTWTHEFGGYPWSFRRYNNVNNGAEYVRFEVDSMDNDTIVSAAERCERACSNVIIVPGNYFDICAQFYLEPGPAYDHASGNWAEPFQVHYNNVAGNVAADILSLSLIGPGGTGSTDTFSVFSQKTVTGSSVANVFYTATSSFSRGTWYFLRYAGQWSTSGSADIVGCWLGTNSAISASTPCPKVVSTTGAFWDQASGINAYVKQGFYSGDFLQNIGIPRAIQIANHMAVTGTATSVMNTFSSFTTSPPVLPTHL